MIYNSEFSYLDKSIHDRNIFDCGEDELNIFIKTKASKHMEIGISKTLVLQSSDILDNNKYRICSFYSVAPTSITRESLPSSISKKLPTYPVPVFLIAQLGVDIKYHGIGLGKITLIKALEYLYNINSKISAFAIVVDCLNEKAVSFYSKYGFKILCNHNDRLRMFISMKDVESIFKNR